MHGSVFKPVHRQVGALVRVFGGEFLVDIDAQSGPLARMQLPVTETVSMREDRIGFIGVPHIFLDAEIRH